MPLKIYALIVFIFVLWPLGWVRRTTGRSPFVARRDPQSAWDQSFGPDSRGR
ncbi:hypothetical protein ACAN107058_05560 [Paracidovorax anthurii]|uniref:Uncharacterized protein n=1 Tax=Paracidovorax anthurii TaxID=78229 RepID=A0A328Z5D7_9BURK|nr:hypothetical protein AX018_10209 [Paracidovorax anthurii]